jgi:hypothetical protein
MARKKAIPEGQGDLIDVRPENEKQIIAVAKKYKKAVRSRMAVLQDEKSLKNELLELIHAAKLKTVDGKITLNVDGMVITVTPRDELIRVKEEGDDENGDE